MGTDNDPLIILLMIIIECFNLFMFYLLSLLLLLNNW